MCKKLFDFITTFFNKDQKEKSLLEVNTSIHSQDKVNSKSKRIKKGNDNSINVIGDDTKVDDHSTTVQCDQYNQQNYYLDNESSDLIVHARWLYNVPHEIKRVQNEIDSFNVLSPIDPNYIQPSLRVTLDDVDDKYHGVYFCITKNVAIKNLNFYPSNYPWIPVKHRSTEMKMFLQSLTKVLHLWFMARITKRGTVT